MISILGKSLFSFFSQKDAVQFSMCKVLHNVLLWKKCLSNVDKGGQICVTAVDGMNVPQLADQKPNFAILVIFIRVILWLFH